MPGRHSKVEIRLSRGVVQLPFGSRTQLLARLRHLDSAGDVVRAFEQVGASEPVQLSRADMQLLVDVIESWGWSTEGGPERGLPAGALELRSALLDDLDDLHDDPPPTA
jgi:hypothetical protein